MSRHFLLSFALIFALSLSFTTSRADIIITEIMYDPPGSENANEYIEIYNTGPDMMPLNGFTIGDGTGVDELIAYPDPASSYAYELYPFCYALILDPDYWGDDGGIYDDRIPVYALLFTVEDGTLGSGGLSNSTAETIILRTPSNIIESQRTYQLGAGDGQSEERIDLEGGESDENWGFSMPGGTPGDVNSIALLDRDLAVTSVELELLPNQPEMFRPVRIRATVENVGAETHSSGLYVVVERYGGDRSYGWVFYERLDSWVYASGERKVHEILFDAVGGGDFRVSAGLRTDDERTSNNALSVDTLLSYPPGVLRISEVMANPSAGRNVEWVELLNLDSLSSPTQSWINLAGWSLRDAQGIELTVSEEAMWIATRETSTNSRFVLAQNESIFQWSGVTAQHIGIGDVWPSLNNDGDTLFLIDPTGEVIDQVSFGPSEQGKSLVRTNLDHDAGTEDWVVSLNSDGGSPGREEDIVLTGRDFAIEELDTLMEWGYLNEYMEGWEYTLNVRVSSTGSGPAPDTLSLRIKTTEYGSDLLMSQAYNKQFTTPESGGETIVQFVQFTSSPGLCQVELKLLLDDDIPANDTLSAYYQLPYSRSAAWVSEVMANPAPNGGGEWLELYVYENSPISLAGWELYDDAGNRTRPLPYGQPFKRYGGYVILAQDSAEFVTAWPEVDPATIVPCSTWAGLNDEGDRLTLFDQTGGVIHSTQFGVSTTPGRSLEASYPNATIDGWYPSTGERGATPGAVQSNPNPAAVIAEDYSVEITPNPFSPDGDGFEDRVSFIVRMPHNYAIVTLRLFDVRGRAVGVILDSKHITSGVAYEWDGQSGLTISTLRAGMYLWVAEIATGSQTKLLKGTLVSAGAR